MPEALAPIEIPDRALFKANEVCELVQVQPYVLRSWESEFPALGVAKAGGVGRVYRREDVEQVVRIKHLLLVEGLTLAGARRKIEEEASPVAADSPAIDNLFGTNARQRLTEVKRGLRSILQLLSARAATSEFSLTPQPVASGASRTSVASGVASGFSRTSSEATPASRSKTPPSKAGPSSRPKRSA